MANALVKHCSLISIPQSSMKVSVTTAYALIENCDLTVIPRSSFYNASIFPLLFMHTNQLMDKDWSSALKHCTCNSAGAIHQTISLLECSMVLCLHLRIMKMQSTPTISHTSTFATFNFLYGLSLYLQLASTSAPVFAFLAYLCLGGCQSLIKVMRTHFYH